MQAFGFEQGCEQSVLVFAVAVLVVENVCGGVGLVAAWLFVRALMSASRSMGRRVSKKEKSEILTGAAVGGE